MRMLSLSGGLGDDYGDYDYGGGQPVDWTNNTSSSGMTPTQIANLIGYGAGTIANALHPPIAGPYVIPGTNTIYNPNPQVGAVIGAAGIPAAPQISAGFTISPIVVVIALAAVVAFMGGRK